MNSDFFGVGYNESGAKLCTLKPKNILLYHSKSSEIKAINFGSLCQRSRR
jgi:hypothetical protein